MHVEVRYCKKHKKPFNSKDNCPVCEAMETLKDEKYKGHVRPNKNHKKCESEGICGSGCSNKGCTGQN